MKVKVEKKRKVILISLGVIVLISISLLLYKTFASFTESTEFQVMNGKVDYFGNSDIYFVFYEGDKQLEEMPGKDNKEDLVYEHGECDNGASIEWDDYEWAPLIKGLNSVKTKCSLYFKKQTYIKFGEIEIPVVERGDGLYEVSHEVSEIDKEWNKSEYRYAGYNPNNYVLFNNEIWRIIGLVNVKTESGVEQRLKIIRVNGIEEQKDFGNYYWDIDTNNWATSTLKNMLNGIYYNSSIGECYFDRSNLDSKTCDFNSGEDLPKGLNESAQNMIDKEVIWNIGGSNRYLDITVNTLYEKERGTSTGSSNTYPAEWSSKTDIGESFNGIGLIYPSDFGYSTNGGKIGRKKCFDEYLYNWHNEENVNYKNECGGNDWLTPSTGYYWTMTTRASSTTNGVFAVYSSGSISIDAPNRVGYPYEVRPVVYLKSSVKIIDGTGKIDSPFIVSLN